MADFWAIKIKIISITDFLSTLVEVCILRVLSAWFDNVGWWVMSGQTDRLGRVLPAMTDCFRGICRQHSHTVCLLVMYHINSLKRNTRIVLSTCAFRAPAYQIGETSFNSHKLKNYCKYIGQIPWKITGYKPEIKSRLFILMNKLNDI